MLGAPEQSRGRFSASIIAAKVRELSFGRFALCIHFPPLLITKIGVQCVPELISPTDAIFEHFTTLTYDPTSKAKTDAHTLDLEPVPPLPINTAPHKDDGDASTRASTPMAPDTPLANGAQKEQTPKVRVALTFTCAVCKSRSPRLLHLA